jgi:hypothetical protein
LLGKPAYTFWIMSRSNTIFLIKNLELRIKNWRLDVGF